MEPAVEPVSEPDPVVTDGAAAPADAPARADAAPAAAEASPAQPAPPAAGRPADGESALKALTKERQQQAITLAQTLGLDFNEAKFLKEAPDTLGVMAERLVADRMAQMILEDVATENRRVTDLEVLSVLQAWAFKKNEARQNVLPEGQRWVHSDTLGLIRLRTGGFGVTSATQEYPHVTQVLNTWLRDRSPAELGGEHFPCTSISLNCNYAARRHRDGNNAGPSMIKAFGNFTGGELEDWSHDDRIVLNLRENMALFDGCRGHEVDDFKGERFSVVWFSAGKFWTMTEEQKEFLEECGFTVPNGQDLGPVTKLLPPPRGYTKCQSLSKMFGVKERAKVFTWAENPDSQEEAQAKALLSGFSAELASLREVKDREAAERAACEAACAQEHAKGEGAEEAREVDVGEPAAEHNPQDKREGQEEPTPAEMPRVKFGPLDQVFGRRGQPGAVAPLAAPTASLPGPPAAVADAAADVPAQVRDRVPELDVPMSPLPKKLRGVSEEFPLGQMLSAEKKRPRSGAADIAPAWKRLRETPSALKDQQTASCGTPIPVMVPTCEGSLEGLLTQVAGKDLALEQQYPGEQVQIG